MRLLNKRVHVAKSLGRENVTKHVVFRRLTPKYHSFACHVLTGHHILSQTQRHTPSISYSEHNHSSLSLSKAENALSVNNDVQYLFVVPEYVTTFGQELKVYSLHVRLSYNKVKLFVLSSSRCRWWVHVKSWATGITARLPA
jgi:hypothetical protein